MEMPVLDKETETEFALNSVMLNLMLMPQMAQYMKDGAPVPPELRSEVNKKIAWVVGKSPVIMTELIRRDDRIKELEAQVAKMLLTGPADGKPGE